MTVTDFEWPRDLATAYMRANHRESLLPPLQLKVQPTTKYMHSAPSVSVVPRIRDLLVVQREMHALQYAKVVVKLNDFLACIVRQLTIAKKTAQPSGRKIVAMIAIQAARCECDANRVVLPGPA